MNTADGVRGRETVKRHLVKAGLAFIALCAIWLSASVAAWMVQRDFGAVKVSDVEFENHNGLTVRGKLFVPSGASADSKVPGAVYVHGYQNNRETSDPFGIELSRRGVAMLCIDALGRGNSDNQFIGAPYEFDDTCGTAGALEYLRGLEFVDAERTALLGHSMGSGMAYTVALKDAGLKALVISGYGYTVEADNRHPANMLMIFGRYDEYRRRMTGTEDFASEWMSAPATVKVFGRDDAEMGRIYGDFDDGTARMVYMPDTIHMLESHDRGSISTAADWIRRALKPDDAAWIPADRQIWELKEYATLVGLISSVLLLLPLGYLLLNTPFFAGLRRKGRERYSCTASARRRAALVNGGLMLLYLPLVLVLFGFHLYVANIDRVFPMMMVNGVAFWFVTINLAGFFLFLAWKKKNPEISLVDLGVSDDPDRMRIDGRSFGKSALFASVLFGFVYFVEWLFERLFVVDLRFLFPFASDLTPYRFLMFILYLPFFVFGFMQTGIFLHGQIRPAARRSFFTTFLHRTAVNWLVMLVPLAIHLAVQYVPLLLGGPIPFVGPGAALVGFVLNLFHMVIVLFLITPVGTWFSELTGKIYTGAILNALLVAWMFASSSVIAPIPV